MENHTCWRLGYGSYTCTAFNLEYLFQGEQFDVIFHQGLLEHFSNEELEMLETIAQKWEKFSGKEMTDASHGEAPWIATKPSCVIDYNLAYYRNKYNEMEKM
jgi:uncharacterized phage-associated protein